MSKIIVIRDGVILYLPNTIDLRKIEERPEGLIFLIESILLKLQRKIRGIRKYN
jgi:hypothetical protein